MASLGRINVKSPNRQLILDNPDGAYRWYRIHNDGPGVMGVTFTDSGNQGGRSRTISIGLSMDILGSKIEIRDDGGEDHVEGTFETIDS